MSTIARRTMTSTITTKPSVHHHAVPHRPDWPTTTHPFVTDGGLETDLIHRRGVQLRHFAAYPLLRTERGRAVLAAYFGDYATLAARVGAGLLLETATRRANPDWGARLGDDRRALYDANVRAVRHLRELRESYVDVDDVLVSGAVGPRADAYADVPPVDPDDAQVYHEQQIGAFAEAGVDLVTAFALSDPGEAIGIARAAFFHGLPVVVGFTVETDGRLPSGATLADAITATDDATGGSPLHYMINCAHPSHFDHVLDEALGDGAAWLGRLRAIRANASAKSHQELDEATELDAGDPTDLAARYAALGRRLPALHVVGGCCGTDHRHVEAIANAFRP